MTNQMQMCYQGGHNATLKMVSDKITTLEKERFYLLKDGKDITELDKELGQLDETLSDLLKNNKYFGL